MRKYRWEDRLSATPAAVSLCLNLLSSPLLVSTILPMPPPLFPRPSPLPVVCSFVRSFVRSFALLFGSGSRGHRSPISNRDEDVSI